MDAVDKIEAKIKDELSWLQRHEKLVLSVIAGLVLWFVIGKIDTAIQHHDEANLAQAKVIAAEDASKTAAIAAQVAQQAAQYKELADKVQAQNAALAQANVQLSQALAKQQHTDATLPPSELVARWNTLVPQANAQLTPNGVTLPSVGAVETVQQLEEVPVLRTQLDNERTRTANALSLVAAEGTQIATLNTEVTALHTQIVDNSKECQAQIKVLKDQEAKKRKWYALIFSVVGFGVRSYIHSATGL